jgi:hypothetical protein
VDFFARHLLRADHNERVELIEMRGLLADNLPNALHEMQAVAGGTACKNFLYHCHLNPRIEEVLTPAQWVQAVDIAERRLGLEGQPRVVVEHQKGGRVHRHVVWSRIDPETMTARHDGLNYRAHERAAREIEAALDLAPVAGALVRERGTTRPERRGKDWEQFRAAESQIDPKTISAEVTALWHAADTGPAFATALAERGYILARGDKPGALCLIDRAGDDHGLTRRLSGVKAAAVRAKMAEVDRDSLPSVAEARALARKAGGSTMPVSYETDRGPARESLPGSQRPRREVPPGARRLDGAPVRVNGWGYEWRALADRATDYAATVLAHWLDEAPGPWRRLARDMVGLAALLHRQPDGANTWRDRLAGERHQIIAKRD